ncbi:MAG TPA: hypothetical protein VFI20_06205 [Terracidiphilus sp.]|nr:hypothetical protein [Terracidiphilus sp.]
MSHCSPRAGPGLAAHLSEGFHSGSIYSILDPAMAKRKQPRFSATKAVKANARERVGQPKPARVVETAPRTGRRAKYKPGLEETIRQQD